MDCNQLTSLTEKLGRSTAMSYTEPSLTADKNNTLKQGQGRKNSNAINKDDLPIGHTQLTSLTAKAVLGVRTHV